MKRFNLWWRALSLLGLTFCIGESGDFHLPGFIGKSAFANTWAKTYGGADRELALSVQQTFDTGYIVAGCANSFGAGDYDFLVIKLDPSGDVEWSKTFGGTDVDYAYCVQQTFDTGYIMIGHTKSFGTSNYDILVIKSDSSGNIEWSKTYGGGSAEFGFCIQQTPDTGYIVGGYTSSFGAGGGDFLAMKLSSSGTIDWAKTYGGSTGVEYASSVQQTSDAGYIVAGVTSSFGAGSTDFLVIKLDSGSDVEWAKTFGGTGSEDLSFIQQTYDNGYIIAGSSNSYGVDNYDFLVIKIDSSGSLKWTKTFGGSGADDAYSIQQTPDSGYIVAGFSQPFALAGGNFAIIKLNSSGSLDWSKVFGETTSEEAHSIQRTFDGGYIAAGYIEPSSPLVEDFLVIKIDSAAQMDPTCPWVNAPQSITSPTPITSSPTVIEAFCAPTTIPIGVTVNLPPLITSTICGGAGIEERTKNPDLSRQNAKLFQNYPNPFTSRTMISYVLPRDANVHLAVYDISGRKVLTLVSQKMNAGGHSIEWEGKNPEGNRVTNGVYFLKLKTDSVAITQRMTVLR